MTYITNLLATVFSANVGESEAQQRLFLDYIASNPDQRQRDGLRAELNAALADPEYDWDALLDDHEVYPGEGQTSRQFIVSQIWNPLFAQETETARSG